MALGTDHTVIRANRPVGPVGAAPAGGVRHVRIVCCTRRPNPAGSVGPVRRILLSPWWLARHALALALIAFFLRMGVWQWTKGESDHGSMQNLFYGVEWPMFAAFVAYWWYRMISEDLRPRDPDDPGPQWGKAGRIAPEAPAPTGGDPLNGPGSLVAVPRQGKAGTVAVTPPPARLGRPTAGDPLAEVETDEDRELAAYNRYLASLYERDAAGSDNDTKGDRR
ncbi:conserved hypothetical protein [Frankia sp. Hr75.2]|nr:conserved hypothetical protein [Frankia sp. Hr75.2]